MFAVVPLLVALAAPPRLAVIEGTVRDPAGAPLTGAMVLLDGQLPGTRSDVRGRYRIEDVGAGRHLLRVTLAGFQPFERTVEVRGERLQQDVVLAPVVAAPLPQERRETAQRDAANEAFRQFPGAPAPGIAKSKSGYFAPPFNTEDYHHRVDNRFLTVAANPLSTFAIDVDAASYANVRRFLTQGQLPPADAVRVEELVNYFRYDYPEPRGDEPFALTTASMTAPWATDHRLVLVGIQGRRIEAGRLPASNLVFLIDVSGSMSSPDKLPLVKRAFRLLVEQLRAQDRVAIVVYAGAAGLVLPPTSGGDKETILAALDRLEAGGSTAGGAGIKLAYDVAREQHLAEGNNRVILATDGDFNVGVSSEGELVRLVDQRKREGTFLTVLGFGTGNLKDSRMEALADKGNGHYAYVDDIFEARKVFVQELGATLVTIAKDVKVQVEFNPSQVAEYRLLGYENRLLAAEDFNDDAKDGGELGAGHAVTAIYEIVPAGQRSGGSVDELRYQSRGTPREGARSDELLTVKLRYQPPAGGSSRLVSKVVRTDERAGNETLGFAAAVAEFGMLLRNSEYKGSATWDQVLTLARRGMGRDEGGYRAEFVRLVEVARSLSAGTDREVGVR